MFNIEVSIWNFTGFKASAEARKSGIRVTVEDTDAPFGELLEDTGSVSKEISWDTYERGVPCVARVAQDLAEELFFNQLRKCRELVTPVK